MLGQLRDFLAFVAAQRNKPSKFLISPASALSSKDYRHILFFFLLNRHNSFPILAFNSGNTASIYSAQKDKTLPKENCSQDCTRSCLFPERVSYTSKGTDLLCTSSTSPARGRKEVLSQLFWQCFLNSPVSQSCWNGP